MPHPLAAVLHRAANGEFPATDGATDVLPPDDDGTVGVVAFTGHAYVFADVDPGDCAARLGGGGGGFGGALAPHLQQWLAGTERSIGSLDVVLVAPAGRRDGASLPRRDDQLSHDRVQRALRHRRDVQACGDDNGLVIIGRGLVGRWELSVELFDPEDTAPGAGRRLIDAGLGLVPDGEWCWAQVAAGNSRSLRAFLAVGFVPVCSEVLISEAEHDQR